MTRPRPLWLSDDDVNALIDPAALVGALRQGFAAVEAGDMREAQAFTMHGLDGASSYLSTFPAHDRTSGLASVKILSGRPQNAAEGRPEIDAVVALADAQTGAIVALMSARTLTALRTAGVTALAVEAMAGQGPHRIGLVGTGVQAVAHARVLAATGLASDFLIAAPRRGDGRAADFARDVSAMTGRQAQASSVETIAASCNVLVTMTLADSPLPLGPLPERLMLACVGPFLPSAHEIDPGLLRRADRVVSDLPERLCRQWVGSPLLDPRQIDVKALGTLLAGANLPAQAGLSVFLSDGRGFEDNVAAALVLAAAVRSGRGLPLS